MMQFAREIEKLVSKGITTYLSSASCLNSVLEALKMCDKSLADVAE